MPDEQKDPSANTAAFQAFVRQVASGDPELKGSRSKIGIMIGIAAAVIVLAAVIVFFAAG